MGRILNSVASWFKSEPEIDLSAIDQVAQVVTTRELFDFIKEQQKQSSELVKTVLEANVAQSKTLQSYIDLFTPRTQPSPSLGEREAAKAATLNVDEDQWEAIHSVDQFNSLMGVPPDISELE